MPTEITLRLTEAELKLFIELLGTASWHEPLRYRLMQALERAKAEALSSPKEGGID